MRFKKLNINNETDKNILLSYFFKKLTTPVNKEMLLGLSCIWYDSNKKVILPCTKRFKSKLDAFNTIQIEKNNVEDTLKKALDGELKMQEELVRCELSCDNSSDYFYIAVIGVDFFLTEKELRV